jgi:hypothetical protein
MKFKMLGEVTQLLSDLSHPKLRFLDPVSWKIVKSSVRRKRPARGIKAIVRNKDRIIIYHLLSCCHVLCIFTSLFYLIFPTTLNRYCFTHFTDETAEIQKD